LIVGFNSTRSFYHPPKVGANDPGLKEKTANFDVTITEKRTSFVEQIEVNEDNDIEYFTVPAHNYVLAADFLFDFKMVRFFF